MRQTALRRKPAKRREPLPAEIRDTVMARAQGRCEVASPRCGEGGTLRFHHRQTVQHGGAHEVVNGLAAIDPCHWWLHAHPALSRVNGWLVPRGDDPAVVPVLVGEVFVLLSNTGRYETTGETG